MKNNGTEDFVQKALLIHGNLYDYSDSVYLGSKLPVSIKCKIHGEFKQTPNNHLRSGGCNACGYERMAIGLAKSGEDFIKQANIVHKNLYDYSLTKYISSHKKITVICKDHGKFEVEASSHIKGKTCRKCSFDVLGKSKRLSVDDFIKKAILVHGLRYGYGEVKYKTSANKITIVCNSHGEFYQTPNEHLSGSGCPSCSGRGYNPKENGTLYMLKSLCGCYVKIGITNNLIGRMKQLKRHTPFEFYVKESRIGNGEVIKKMERYIHKKSKSARFKGFDGATEWFEDSVEFIKYFKKEV